MTAEEIEGVKFRVRSRYEWVSCKEYSMLEDLKCLLSRNKELEEENKKLKDILTPKCGFSLVV